MGAFKVETVVRGVMNEERIGSFIVKVVRGRGKLMKIRRKGFKEIIRTFKLKFDSRIDLTWKIETREVETAWIEREFQR